MLPTVQKYQMLNKVCDHRLLNTQNKRRSTVYKGNVQRHHQRIAWEPCPDKSIIFALPAPQIVPIPAHMMTAANESSALVPEN